MRRLRYWLKCPILVLASIPGIGYTGSRYNCGQWRLALVIGGLIRLAEGLVVVLSIGTFSPDWHFNWVFSDTCRRLEGEKS